MNVGEIILSIAVVLFIALIFQHIYIKIANKRRAKEIIKIRNAVQKALEKQYSHDCAHFHKEIAKWSREFISWINENDASGDEIIESLNKMSDNQDQESALWSVKKC